MSEDLGESTEGENPPLILKMCLYKESYELCEDCPNKEICEDMINNE